MLNLTRNVMLPPDYELAVQYWLDSGDSSRWIPYDFYNPPQRLEYRQALPNELVFEVDIVILICPTCGGSWDSHDVWSNKTRGIWECPDCEITNKITKDFMDDENAWLLSRMWILKLIDAIHKLEERGPVWEIPSIPYYLYASSGKGLHLHIFLHWPELSRSVEDFRKIRRRSSDMILRFMDRKGLDVGEGETLDMACILKTRQLIKIEGMWNRKTERHKTLLACPGFQAFDELIPYSRDECYTVRPQIPMEILRWDIPTWAY